MTAPLLKAEGLHVLLGGTPVLRDLSIDVSAGEVLGVFGPSGAGKSTLFRALAGEERLAAGQVALAGEDVTSLPLFRRAQRGLGYLPQTPSVLWDLTVAENIAVFEALGRPSPAQRRAQPGAPGASDGPGVPGAPGASSGAGRGVELAAALGLEGRLGVRAGALSGGERRRLELVRALSASPRVLLCDEPFAAIDPIGAAAVAARLRALAEAGGAVLIADHHVAEALCLCDRAALLLEGEIVVVARPDVFLADGRVRKHYAPERPGRPESPQNR